SRLVVERGRRQTRGGPAARSAFGRLARQRQLVGFLRSVPSSRRGAVARLVERRSFGVRLSWLELRRRRPMHAHSVAANRSRNPSQGARQDVSRAGTLRSRLGLSRRAASGYSRVSARIWRPNL